MVTMPGAAVSTRLKTMTAIVVKAGAVVMRHYANGVDVRHKPDRSPVTDADEEAEAAHVLIHASPTSAGGTGSGPGPVGSAGVGKLAEFAPATCFVPLAAGTISPHNCKLLPGSPRDRHAHHRPRTL